MSGMVYGKNVDGVHHLMFVGPNDPIPEGYSSLAKLTKDMSSGMAILTSAFGTLTYKIRDADAVYLSLIDLAQKLKENQ